MNIHHGMNRRDLDGIFRALGGAVVILRRTGDIQYSHPSVDKTVRANSRRKDAPRSLTDFAMRVAKGVV